MYSQGIVKEVSSRGLTILAPSKEPQTQTLQRQVEGNREWWGLRQSRGAPPGEGGYHSTPADVAVSNSRPGVARSLDFS